MKAPLKALISLRGEELLGKTVKVLEQFRNLKGMNMIIQHAETLTRIDDWFATENPNLLVLCSDIAHEYNFYSLGPYLKSSYPRLRILMIIKDNFRHAFRMVSSGVDEIVFGRSEDFGADMIYALSRLYVAIEESKKHMDYFSQVFNPDNYPAVMYGLKGSGIKLLAKDFDVFPDSSNKYEKLTNEFLTNLGLHLGLLVGQGHTYHESCYFMPAGDSTEYSILVFSFRLNDPDAEEERLSYGYYLFGLFIKNEYFRVFPSISELEPLVEYIKKLIPDSRTLNESIVGLKFSLINRIKTLS